MVFRLHGSRNHPKHVFYIGGHAHHTMGLQLTAVDHRIRLQKPGCAGKAVHHLSLRMSDLLDRYIQIQLGSRLFCLHKSGQPVIFFQYSRSKKSSRGISDHYLRTFLLKKFCKCCNHRRMGHDSFFRGGGRYQICLNSHTHARPHKIQSVCLFQQTL